MQSHHHYMQRALQLAAYGRGSVSPNPMVGCVIVHQGSIIGEGWHRQYGQAHAEVNAVAVVKDKSLLSEAIVYVTLEPCSHFGKTPPCADLLIQHGVKQVVVCNLDPNPLVAGKGVEKLQNTGAEVIVGILEAEGRALNRRFFTMMEQRRPYIILKYAQTADGFIAGEDFEQVQISNASSKRLVHQWRAEEDAIMVGFNTALHDNPALTVREASGRNPIRIVLDRKLQLPKTHQLFNQEAATIVYHQAGFELNSTELNQNVSLQSLDYQLPIIPQILSDLYSRKIQSVLVEGGSKLLQSFIDAGFYDEIRVFNSKKMLHRGIKAPILPIHLKSSEENIFGDILVIYQ
jgi:diaminohydroxyphosphoribosylaminopyrimidine deaminase / 5-amino-6-(5-phosphoribosylamino)uracil reductase